MGEHRPISVLNIHWGFSIGGVSQYAAVIDQVGDYAPIEMSTLCVVSHKRHVDEQVLSGLHNATLIKRRGLFDFTWITALRIAIEASAPDLVMTHGFNGHIIAGFVRMLLTVKPRMIASYHGEYHPPTRAKKLLEAIYNGFTAWYMRRVAARVVSVAECGRKHLVSRGVSPDKIVVIHNGIPDVDPGSEDRRALRRELEIADDALVVGIVSRLEPIKGIPFLLRAIQRLKDGFPHLCLVIIGSGVQEAALRYLVNELGLDDAVIFAGFRSNASRYLPALDVFALPSLSEFHSIGLLEAMRASTAIVATDVGGNTESIENDRHGLVVPAADVEALTSALRHLLSSDELRTWLGAAARQRFVDEFTLEHTLRRSAEFFVRAAGERTSTQA